MSDADNISGTQEQPELGHRISEITTQFILWFIRGNTHFGRVDFCFMSWSHGCWPCHGRAHTQLCLAERIGDEEMGFLNIQGFAETDAQ